MGCDRAQQGSGVLNCRLVIARSEAMKQSRATRGTLDCFVEPVIGRAFARPVGSQWRGWYRVRRLLFV